MQIAAQIEKAPVAARECGGHRGNRFVPVAAGRGRWRYYWLDSKQARYWRSRSEPEKAELVKSQGSRCFVCHLQAAMDAEARFVDGLYAAMMRSLLGNH